MDIRDSVRKIFLLQKEIEHVLEFAKYKFDEFEGKNQDPNVYYIFSSYQILSNEKIRIFYNVEYGDISVKEHFDVVI